MRHEDRMGKRALVRYRGGAEGEELIEDFSIGDPVEIRIGNGEVPPGIDAILYELEVGESRIVKIPPERAYGLYDNDGIQRYPKSYVGNATDLERGETCLWTNPASGKKIPVRVVDLTPDTVTLDFNHPLAGKTLEYWFELVGIL